MDINRFSFSAKKIQDFIDCERRYELRYILNQSWPAITSEPILEIESNIKKGNEFHYLVHQSFSGIPEKMLRDTIRDDIMINWFDNFLSFHKTLKVKSIFSEFPLTAQINENKLTAVYDLIYLNENEGVGIIDWKTSKYIPKKNTLAQKVQSILYPFILHEVSAEFFPGSHYPPEIISMRYWFPSAPKDDFVFPYGHAVHEDNRVFLENIIREIQGKKIGDFELTKDEKKCGFCPYRSLCNRGITASNFLKSESYNMDGSDLSLDFDQLPEIPFEI